MMAGGSKTIRPGGLSSTSACGADQSGSDQPTCERTVLPSAVSSMLRSAELLGGETCRQHRSACALLSDAGAVSGRPAEVDAFRGESVQGRAIAEAAWESFPEHRDGPTDCTQPALAAGSAFWRCRERAPDVFYTRGWVFFPPPALSLRPDTV